MEIELGRNCVEIVEICGTFTEVPQNFVSNSEYLYFSMDEKMFFFYVENGRVVVLLVLTFWYRWPSGTDLLI